MFNRWHYLDKQLLKMCARFDTVKINGYRKVYENFGLISEQERDAAIYQSIHCMESWDEKKQSTS